MEITWRVIRGEREGRMRGQGTGNKKHNWYEQNRQEEVDNSIASREAKELVCMTHGHEPRGVMLDSRGCRAEGG